MSETKNNMKKHKNIYKIRTRRTNNNKKNQKDKNNTKKGRMFLNNIEIFPDANNQNICIDNGLVIVNSGEDTHIYDYDFKKIKTLKKGYFLQNSISNKKELYFSECSLNIKTFTYESHSLETLDRELFKMDKVIYPFIDVKNDFLFCKSQTEIFSYSLNISYLVESISFI